MRDKADLDEGNNFVESIDLSVWTKQIDSADTRQRIRNEAIGDATISTDLLSHADNCGSGPPLRFETMVFGEATDQDHRISSICENALDRHEKAKQRSIAAEQEKAAKDRLSAPTADLIEACIVLLQEISSLSLRHTKEDSIFENEVTDKRTQCRYCIARAAITRVNKKDRF